MENKEKMREVKQQRSRKLLEEYTQKNEDKMFHMLKRSQDQEEVYKKKQHMQKHQFELRKREQEKKRETVAR